MGLSIGIKVGEVIKIGDSIFITYSRKRGQQITLHFEAPREINIKRLRKESYDKK